mmetsp:Transcript_17581/g.49137  ORF Transcript_17581/g.49137 Transcript_17581/m.49137 type:complete len:241 (-) Transcript_17581:734-1456(-)
MPASCARATTRSHLLALARAPRQSRGRRWPSSPPRAPMPRRRWLSSTSQRRCLHRRRWPRGCAASQPCRRWASASCPSRRPARLAPRGWGLRPHVRPRPASKRSTCAASACGVPRRRSSSRRSRAPASAPSTCRAPPPPERSSRRPCEAGATGASTALRRGGRRCRSARARNGPARLWRHARTAACRALRARRCGRASPFWLATLGAARRRAPRARRERQRLWCGRWPRARRACRGERRA